MHFETFAAGVSILHKLDPRVRVISALLLAFSLALTKSLVFAGLGFCFGLGLIFIGHFPLMQVLHRLMVVNIFLVPVWVLLPFSFSGNNLEVAFRLGPFTASWQGIWLAFLITVKSNAIIFISLALLCSMRVITLVRAFEGLQLPNKLCQILFFSLRYFQVIHAEYHRLHDAMQVRGFTRRSNLHTIKTYGYLISMLLVRSLNRGQRVYEAMLCRGYTGKMYIVQEFSLNRFDKLFLSLCLFVTILFWAGQAVL